MVPLYVLHPHVIRRLSGGLVRHPRHHQSAERRRCAGPLQCDVIDDIIKLLNDDAALELFVGIIVALVAAVSCVRKTHIGWISVFLTLFSITRGYYDFFTHTRAGCSSGRVAAPTGRYCPGSAAPRSSSPSTTPPGCWTTTQPAVGRRRSVAIIAAGLGCRDTLTQVFFLCVSVPVGGKTRDSFGPSSLVFLFLQVGRRLLRR